MESWLSVIHVRWIADVANARRATHLVARRALQGRQGGAVELLQRRGRRRRGYGGLPTRATSRGSRPSRRS